MENKPEDLELQQNLEAEAEAAKKAALKEEEIAELKRRAEVSSQNFERAKKAELELKELKAKNSSQQFGDDDYSDEGKALRAEILAMKEEVSSFKRLKEEESVFNTYPQLKDKKDEFKEFLEDPELKGLSLEKSAKLFMVENNLIDQEVVKRKGLEKSTSGTKGEVKKGFSEEDVRRLRETQPRKYEQMLRDGRLNPDQITN